MALPVFIIETECSKKVASEKIDALNHLMRGLTFTDVVEIMMTAIQINIAQASPCAADSWAHVIETIDRKILGLIDIEPEGNA